MKQNAASYSVKRAMFGGVVVTVAIVAIAWVGLSFIYTPKAVVEKHVQALQQGEYTDAYNYFSHAAQAATSFTDFRTHLSKTPVLLYVSSYDFVQGRRDGDMIVYGMVQGKEGTAPVQAEYTMVRNGLRWKIQQYAIGQLAHEGVQMSIRLDDLGINLTSENTITTKRSFTLAERMPVSVVGLLQQMPKGAILTGVLINMDTNQAVATRKITIAEDIVSGGFSFTFDEATNLPVGTHAVLVNLFPSEETMNAVDQQVIRFRVTE